MCTILRTILWSLYIFCDMMNEWLVLKYPWKGPVEFMVAYTIFYALRTLHYLKAMQGCPTVALSTTCIYCRGSQHVVILVDSLVLQITMHMMLKISSKAIPFPLVQNHTLLPFHSCHCLDLTAMPYFPGADFPFILLEMMSHRIPSWCFTFAS